MIQQKRNAFTLVELIVVITILGILSTIGFVSYSGYLQGVRDTNRISQLVSINDGLELYRTRQNLPLPDSNVEVTTNGNAVGYQGYVGKNVLETIEYSNEGKDPKEGTYFTYYLSADKKYFQLMAFLEESDNLVTGIVGDTLASTDYSSKFPTVYGKKLGILTDSNQTPIQEIASIVASGGLDIATTTGTYIVHYDDNDSLTGTGNTLVRSLPNANCKRIKEIRGGSPNGIYTIDPAGNGTGYQVYCDMTTDGGGWTIATMLADTTTNNLFQTANTNKITSLTSNISTKGQIGDIWLDDGDKDIMLKCYTTVSELKGYEEPLIIYDFKKSDITHLTKSGKSGTTFSSTNLAVKWKNKVYTLDTTYSGSGADPSFYLKEGSDYKMAFSMYNSKNIKTDPSYAINSPAYNPSTVSQDLNSTNYCITAIR